MKDRPSAAPPSLPTFDKFITPTVRALRTLGGSASVEELKSWVINDMQLSEEVTTYRREATSVNEVPYRMAWARTYLKQGGVVERTARGVWALTPLGRNITGPDLDAIPGKVRKMRVGAANSRTSNDSTPTQAEDENSWRPRLLDVLKQLEPAAFERLSQRILRESGFIKVEVTGRTGDGGIDGTGVLRI